MSYLALPNTADVLLSEILCVYKPIPDTGQGIAILGAPSAKFGI